MKEGSPITLDELFDHLKKSVRPSVASSQKTTGQFFMKDDVFGRPTVYFQDEDGDQGAVLCFEKDEGGYFRVKLHALDGSKIATTDILTHTDDEWEERITVVGPTGRELWEVEE